MSNRHSNSSPSTVSRREFLKKGALSSLFLGPALITGGNGRAPDKEAKNIIFMVSDGMSSGTLTLADIVSRRQYGHPSHWINLYDSGREFHRGLMDMASLDSPVTGSASAASSWACGNRVNYGSVCIGPKGERYKPIFQICREAGKKTGLVTTTRITHATPAGFSTNVSNRYMEDEIALQYLEREYDLLLGGGARHFISSGREDGKDLLAGFSSKNYRVARTKKQMGRARRGDKMVGLFNGSHLPYTVDHLNSEEYREEIPTVREMTSTALELLSGGDPGFMLMVEGGRVDHGAHGNDAAALVYDQIAFDRALKEVLDFVENRDDTLVIITTDHGNANPGLNAFGRNYSDSGPMLERLFDFRRSNEWILSGLDGSSTVKEIRSRVEYATGIGISDNEARMVLQSRKEKLQMPYHEEEESDSVLGAVLANYIGVNWIGTDHTSDYVELAVLGPGSSQLNPFIRNTELFDLMVETAGIRKYSRTG